MTKEYVALPVRVEALQIDVQFHTEEIARWLMMHKVEFSIAFMDRTLEMPRALNRTWARPGYWIVQGKTGIFAVYTNDEFGSMFGAAGETS